MRDDPLRDHLGFLRGHRRQQNRRTRRRRPERRQSPSRMLACRRAAACCKTVSPAACPNLSLTSLKPSRSRHSTVRKLPSGAGTRVAALSKIVKTLLLHHAIGQAGESVVVREEIIFVLDPVEADENAVMLVQHHDHADETERDLHAGDPEIRDRAQDRRDREGQRHHAHHKHGIARSAGVARRRSSDDTGGADAREQDEEPVARTRRRRRRQPRGWQTR